MNLSKKWQIALSIWAIALTVYLGYDIYAAIRYWVYQAGVSQGYSQAIGELISKVGAKCDTPTPVNMGDKKIDIIDVACLKSSGTKNTSNTDPQASSPTIPPKK